MILWSMSCKGSKILIEKNTEGNKIETKGRRKEKS